ncbi:CocE/NonD family hydrolase [Nonomuraea sp. NPDC059023]|uniref:CocE/NonD family hydrolase n=1 Tax=unclassified Nonomuraea TaxID=2593643 RepID=UPI00368B60E7
MTLLSRLYGVRPAPVRRDVEIPAADGVRLLATHYYPAGQRRPPLVLLRSPYGRGNVLDRLPALLAERGYQVHPAAGLQRRPPMLRPQPQHRRTARDRDEPALFGARDLP